MHRIPTQDHTLEERKNHMIKQRRALTQADMEQIRRQKRADLAAAVHDKALWDWECSIIFPVFDEHPDWTYEQCYDAVCNRNGGHFPEPPKFE
jgi:hypothetical protein